jgi:hypothetical protein
MTIRKIQNTVKTENILHRTHWSASRRLCLLDVSLPCILGRSSAWDVRCCEIEAFLSRSLISNDCELPVPWMTACGTEGVYSPASREDWSRLTFLRLEVLLGSVSSLIVTPFSLSLSSTYTINKK